MRVTDPTRFNHYILGRKPYWTAQRRIGRSLLRHRTTVVPAGNAVGKSYFAAGALLWFLYEHPGCLVVSTAPSQTQLEEVLWKEVRRAHQTSLAELPGELLKQPLKIDLGDGWQALGYSTTKTERFSGHHAKDLLAIVDEASGVAPEIFEAIDSLNPSRYLLIGNPLRPDGKFYELATRGSDLVNVIAVPSLESPDIHLDRSPRGLADQTWLRAARNDYGEGSAWWISHVLARFPDSAFDTLIPRSWLDLAGSVEHVRSGHARMAIDIAEGNDGDPAGYLVRDDNGVLECRIDRAWTLETLAAKAANAARRWRIPPSRITFDAGGPGADFGNRLATAGLKGCLPYKGGTSGGEDFANLRSACAWAFRQRLDPNRTVKRNGVLAKQEPFAIPADLLSKARRELQAVKWEQLGERKIALLPKDDLRKELGHSPTYFDLFLMTFAYPNT